MSKHFKTRGIVLNKRDWRENDYIFSIYTENFGKISAVAVGSRKIKSKLMGHLACPASLEINYVAGRVFNKITHAYAEKGIVLQSDQDLFYLAALWEVVDKAVHEEDIHNGLWQLLLRAQEEILSQISSAGKKLVFNVFAIRLLLLLGYKLNLRDQLPASLGMNQELAELITIIEKEQKPENQSIPTSLNNQLTVFLTKYLQYFLEREIFSLQYIALK